jgi:hypothetical protein
MKMLILFSFFLFLFILLSQTRIEAQVSIINASIYQLYYYYILVSDKLFEGILYTNETGAMQNVQYPLLAGSSNNNAIWNYNKSYQTEYWIIFMGNIPGDICHGATSHLCSTPNCTGPNNVQIDISNAKWSSSLQNDKDNPSLSSAKRFVIGFDNNNKVSTNMQNNTIVYLRYWLDLPPAVPALSYNTTYQIRLVSAGENCV